MPTGTPTAIGSVNVLQTIGGANVFSGSLGYSSSGGGSAYVSPFDSWDIESWRNTFELRQLCHTYQVDFALFLDALTEFHTSNNFNVFKANLETLFTWDTTIIDSTKTHFGWTNNDYFIAETYVKMAKVIAWMTNSKEGFDSWQNWPSIFVTNTPTYLDNQKIIANQVRQCLQNVLADNQWGKYQQEIEDEIRVQKRNALLAYNKHLESNGDGRSFSTIELYKYHLIDPAMSACQYTSRIKQAISSVQLFIQRCLLGLEEGIKSDLPEWKQWDWMQNYRVWEANRKVFLYPENWIEPALRDNKSELFKQFEDKILENEITHENVELALQDYLVKLHHISNLEMKSICYGEDDQVVYVLARTKETPADYYYRKLDKKTWTWTAWEKIEQPIKGEHPILQFYNNRLHIFWLEILERPQEQVMQHDTPPTKAQSIKVDVTNKGSAARKRTKLSTGTEVEKKSTLPQPPKYKEIQLAWIVLYDKGWSPQTLSKQRIIDIWPRPNYSLHLRPRQKVNDLWLDIYVSTSLEFNGSYFYNQFTNEYKELTVTPFNENLPPEHSSSFIFDGFVREVKIKPIDGTYWYVGWDVDGSVVLNEETKTIDKKHRGPIWIYKIDNASVDTFASIGKVYTNYGDFDLSIGTEKTKLNHLLTLNNNQSIYSSIKINSVAYSTQEAKVVMFLILDTIAVNAGIPIQTLNNFIQNGNKNITATKPTETVTIRTYGGNLIRGNNPDEILELPESDSYEYIYHSFGEDGRKIKQLQSHEKQEALNRPVSFHYEYNHIVPNTVFDNDKQKVTLSLSSSSFAELTTNEITHKLTVPLDGAPSFNESYR